MDSPEPTDFVISTKDMVLVIVIALVLAAILIGGTYQAYLQSQEKNVQALKNPPATQYEGPRVEVIGMSQCLTQATPSEFFEEFDGLGVSHVEVIRHGIDYEKCGLFTHDWECGWSHRVGLRTTYSKLDADAAAPRQVDFNKSHDWVHDSMFGVKLDVRDGQVKAYLPVELVDQGRDFGRVCEEYSRQVLGGALNALRWNHTRPEPN